jgi:hypothetical protein
MSGVRGWISGRRISRRACAPRARVGSVPAARRFARSLPPTNALLELREWLVAERVTLVVLEATGDYWRSALSAGGLPECDPGQRPAR